MKTSWTYGVNALPQFNSGTIYLVEEPTWLAFVGWMINILGYGSYLFHWIPMPKWLHISDKDANKKYSLYDWWGDFGQLYHLYIYCPCFYWHEEHPKRLKTNIELGYPKIKELFAERDPQYFTEQEKNAKEILEKD